MTTQKNNNLQWHTDGSFSFPKGSRPSWTTEAKNMKLAQGQDRRHGLHGAEVITKACQIFINNELKKSGTKKTHKKLRVNLKSRLLKNFDKQSLEQLIHTFRRYAFSKVSNLLPGDGDYNKAIESIRKLMLNTKHALHVKFFSHGQMPSEVDSTKYSRHCLALIRRKVSQPKSRIKTIINDTLLNIVIPSIQNASTLRQVDDILTAISDTAKIDIGFASTKAFKRYNARVLALDTRIKRGIVAEEGLTQEIHNKLIGYRPRRKKNN